MFGLFAMHVSDAWSYCVAIHPCVAIPHCLGTSSCVTSSVKREAVIVGLASEGLALILGSAEAGSSAVHVIIIKATFIHTGVERKTIQQ